MSHDETISLWSDHADHWQHDRSVTFLNHGSFGACPTTVLAEQSRLRDQMEAETVRFFTREMQPLLDASRESLAAVLRAETDDLVFVHNATTAVNSVLRSLDWNRGDELLLTNHTYNACRNVVAFLAERAGVVPVVVPVPFPQDHADQVTQLIVARVTSRTRLALIDHVTSATGLVLPILDIVEQLAAKGIDTLVDGAHAPGMVPLDMQYLGAAYYTGNCHKWLCAPKGAAFLHVRRDRQGGIVPTTISHGWNNSRPGHSRFHDIFDWQGTLDPTPWLCVASAVEFTCNLLPGGLSALMDHNREKTLAGRGLLMERLNIDSPCPADMIGSLAALPLPVGAGGADVALDYATVPTASHPLHTRLLKEFQIEVPIFFWPKSPHRLLRISMQAYNTVGQVERLANVLVDLLAQER